MTRIAYLDCIGGLAGDMMLAALLDAGAPRRALDDAVASLGIPGVSVETEPVARHGIVGIHVRVVTREERVDRPVSALRDVITVAHALPSRVRERTLDAIDRLAAAEADIHGLRPDEVHLHELGGVDTLVDLAGAFALLDAAGIERLVCSPLPYARGMSMAHGGLPTPAPATLSLLAGAPFEGVATTNELVTPTGAAIVAVAADGFGELPSLVLERVGYGAGTREVPERPNLLRVLLGLAAPAEVTADVVVVEATIDDLVPELVPDALQEAKDVGAIDTWVTPVQMKKGRPGIVVSALARPADEEAVATALLEHTSTLGVRVARMRRYELAREIRAVQVDSRPIRVKVGLLRGRVVNVAPEHDDCAAVAAGTGRSVKEVWAAALAAASQPSREPRS
ncbi:MAG: nickel pincer cofactor biosynthesis protein LarC [Actinomycetota bacterium]